MESSPRSQMHHWPWDMLVAARRGPERRKSLTGDAVQDSHSTPSQSNRVPRMTLFALGALLLVVAFGAAAIIGSSPRVCAMCHASQAHAARSGPHAEATCYGCHLNGGAWGIVEAKTAEFTRMYPAALLGRGLTVPSEMTARAACLECHQGVLSKTSVANGIRIQHSTCARGDSCDTCHSSVPHGDAVRWVSSPSMNDCVECHTRTGAPSTCETCHSDDARERKAQGEWQVVHGANWKATHGLGDKKTCITCHPVDYCKRCHEVPVPHPVDFGKMHGKLAAANKSACRVCHKDEKNFCDVCHGGTPMPHPDDFARQHSELAVSTKDPRCIRCHVDTDCQDCHSNHAHPGGSKGVPVPWSSTPEVLRP
jgi:hypothetical protein